jgi:hypothetical protein
MILIQNSPKNWRFLLELPLIFAKRITTLTLETLEKNANIFRRKLAEIAENCDHSIDPWFPWFSVLGNELLYNRFFSGKRREVDDFMENC